MSHEASQSYEMPRGNDGKPLDFSAEIAAAAAYQMQGAIEQALDAHVLQKQNEREQKVQAAKAGALELAALRAIPASEKDNRDAARTLELATHIPPTLDVHAVKGAQKVVGIESKAQAAAVKLESLQKQLETRQQRAEKFGTQLDNTRLEQRINILETALGRVSGTKDMAYKHVQRDAQRLAQKAFPEYDETKEDERLTNPDPLDFWGYKETTQSPTHDSPRRAPQAADDEPELDLTWRVAATSEAEPSAAPQTQTAAETDALPPVGEPADDAPAPMFTNGEDVDLPEPLPIDVEADADDEIDQAPVWADDGDQDQGSGDFVWTGTEARVAEPRPWGVPRPDESSFDEEPGTYWPPVIEVEDDADQARPGWGFGGDEVPGGTVSRIDLRDVDHDAPGAEPGYHVTVDGTRISPELRDRLRSVVVGAADAEPAPAAQPEELTISPNERFVIDRIDDVRHAVENLAGDPAALDAYRNSTGPEGAKAILDQVIERLTPEDGFVSAENQALLDRFRQEVAAMLNPEQQPQPDVEAEGSDESRRNRGGRVAKGLARLRVLGRTGTRPRDLLRPDRFRAPR